MHIFLILGELKPKDKSLKSAPSIGPVFSTREKALAWVKRTPVVFDQPVIGWVTADRDILELEVDGDFVDMVPWKKILREEAAAV